MENLRLPLFFFAAAETTAADGRGPEEPGTVCGCAVPEAAVGVAVAAVWAQGPIVLGAEF